MKVLLCSEWSALNTGYGVMTEAIALRLHRLGFEVAELAMYCPEGHPLISQCPWRIYPVEPHPQDKQGRERYDADIHNQFGKLAFHPVLLDFRPQVCLNFQDPWYQTHVVNSPLRPFFRYLYIPTVDAIGQKREWLEWMGRADAVAAYTDWAADVIAREGGPSIPLVGAIPPGVDHSLFKPHPDRKGIRKSFGLPEDALVVGFVSRNQTRKRFPELIRAFSLFLKTAPEYLRERTHLYLHTSWPDIGWDLPQLIRDSGVSSRVWLTYLCHNQNCGKAFSARWAGACRPCTSCGDAAYLPSTKVGVSRETFPLIFSMFDVYTQYANSEGIALPILEAGACGVPVMATDYSGCGDAVRKLEGWPIKVASLHKEIETGCWRASPDDEDFCKKLTEVLSLPEPVRRAKGGLARDGVQRHFDWDRSVLKMAEVLAGFPPASPWDAPPRPHFPAEKIPDGLSNADFVRWGFICVAGRPELAFSVTALRMSQELDWGRSVNGHPHFVDEALLGRSRTTYAVTRESLMGIWREMAAERNHWEGMRCRSIALS